MDAWNWAIHTCTSCITACVAVCPSGPLASRALSLSSSAAAGTAPSRTFSCRRSSSSSGTGPAAPSAGSMGPLWVATLQAQARLTHLYGMRSAGVSGPHPPQQQRQQQLMTGMRSAQSTKLARQAAHVPVSPCHGSTTARLRLTATVMGLQLTCQATAAVLGCCSHQACINPLQPAPAPAARQTAC
jgi:hypothetical protein